MSQRSEQFPEAGGIPCVLCEQDLCESSTPDDRTIALWTRGICRSCGQRLDVDVLTPVGSEVYNSTDGHLGQQ